MNLKLVWKKNRNLVFEILRYVLVGGTAFVLDFLVMVVFNEFVFNGRFLYLSVFLGYLVGLVYNFYLSCAYVFKNGFTKIKNKELQSFIIFALIGIIGLILTEILMYLLVNTLALNYMLSKVLTAMLVMFWNYIARKVIIFK